jgi:hypothetical protein
MKQVKDMTFEELQYQAGKIDWDKVPNHNQIDWMNDDLGVIRVKLETILGNKEYLK